MTAIASKLKQKLTADDTEERCGLVLADGTILDTINKHPQPTTGFLIGVKDLLEHENLVGTWHTHPGQSAALSQDDYLGFSAWHQLTHYIVGTDGVRAYKSDADGVIEELPCS
jgi:proteasome lid subunit RPN8/RPN11